MQPFLFLLFHELPCFIIVFLHKILIVTRYQLHGASCHIWTNMFSSLILILKAFFGHLL